MPKAGKLLPKWRNFAKYGHTAYDLRVFIRLATSLLTPLRTFVRPFVLYVCDLKGLIHGQSVFVLKGIEDDDQNLLITDEGSSNRVATSSRKHSNTFAPVWPDGFYSFHSWSTYYHEKLPNFIQNLPKLATIFAKY